MEKWNFTFCAEKPSRLRRYFWSATVWDDLEPALWWSDEYKAFVPYDRIGSQGGSTNSPTIRTFRAFKRFLRKHPELRGRTVRLVSRYVGFDVDASEAGKRDR
jgi:hypothetical protein